MGWNFLVTAQLLFGTVFPHLYTLLTVSLVLGLGLRLTCSQDICSRPTDALTGSFTRYKFVTLLTYLIIHTHNLYTPTIVAELLNLAWWRTTPRQRTLVVDPALHSRVWSTQEPKFFKHIPHTHTHTHKAVKDRVAKSDMLTHQEQTNQFPSQTHPIPKGRRVWH